MRTAHCHYPTASCQRMLALPTHPHCLGSNQCDGVQPCARSSRRHPPRSPPPLAPSLAQPRRPSPARQTSSGSGITPDPTHSDGRENDLGLDPRFSRFLATSSSPPANLLGPPNRGENPLARAIIPLFLSARHRPRRREPLHLTIAGCVSTSAPRAACSGSTSARPHPRRLRRHRLDPRSPHHRPARRRIQPLALPQPPLSTPTTLPPALTESHRPLGRPPRRRAPPRPAHHPRHPRRPRRHPPRSPTRTRRRQHHRTATRHHSIDEQPTQSSQLKPRN